MSFLIGNLCHEALASEHSSSVIYGEDLGIPSDPTLREMETKGIMMTFQKMKEINTNYMSSI
jgi:hypothetical protein